MKAINFTIENEDLKALFVACRSVYVGYTFERFVEVTKHAYSVYFERNIGDIIKYGEPKTFSKWVNGQVIALT
jgi:hypothetical protein